MAEGGAISEISSASVSESQQLAAAAWDPHHANEVATVHGTAVQGWDLRTMTSTHCLPDAHKYGARDVDYNPNKPFYVVTSGEDRLVKFWDIRKPDRPMKVLLGHSHWAWTVAFNRFHDQLILSGGTDSLVNLWRVSSISSAPLLELEGHNSKPDADVRVRAFDEHEESVYSVAWSACDAWVFVSLSYDGRVVLNHVPSTEKYKILL